MRCSLKCTGLILLMSGIPPYGFAQPFGPECPRIGTFELVEDTSAWADNCFAAVAGRYPNPEHLGESLTFTRDIDLDGNEEILELRGTGNASNAIYVFKVSGGENTYIGQLNAHSSFQVKRDSSGVPTIGYMHRYGVDNIVLIRIQYSDNEFKIME